MSLSGQVDVMFDAVTTMTENIKAGKVARPCYDWSHALDSGP
jgi:tripartite-type tricarboxylate transporter receptor subunit TctC